MPLAQQIFKETLKKKIRSIYENDAACTSVNYRNDFYSLRELGLPLITPISLMAFFIRVNSCNSWQIKKLRSSLSVF